MPSRLNTVLFFIMVGFFTCTTVLIWTLTVTPHP
jgi:hypothetical protein